MTWSSLPSTTLRPLAFDRANRGKSTKSQFPLFQLPVEVLQDVAPHIPPADLETLALVDRDCRQLARSVQFFHVKLTYSDTSLGILETLLAEMHGTQSESSQILGSCIRHLTLDLGHPRLTETRLSRYPTLLGFHKHLPGTNNAQTAYLHALATILCNSLPNLHSLNWQSRMPISTELMQSVTASNARHVVINHALVHAHLDAFDFYGRPRWALESFNLDVTCISDSSEDADMIVAIMTDMLRAASPTLQHLSWKGTRLPFYISFGREMVVFPRLRSLRLDAVRMADFTILSSFLSSNSRISSLEISSLDRVTAEFLDNRGYMQSLECFSWINQSNAHEEEVIAFLEANCQIHSLSIDQPLSPLTIETRILPMIESHFRYLTSLQLVWGSVSIPDTTLFIIGSLPQLRKLWLSAGYQFGWCNNWRIEHDVILDALRPLHQLESLAFSRDSYEVNGHPLLDSSVDKYYVNSVFPVDLNFQTYLKPDERVLIDSLGQKTDISFDHARSLQSRLMKAAWERWHQEKMIALANVYANTFPLLQSCFIGQYPMRVEREGLKVNVIVETTLRQENFRP